MNDSGTVADMADSKGAPLVAGDRVIIRAPHPWATERGTLIAFESYGLGWKGWRVELDVGTECYADPKKLRKLIT